MAAQAAQTLLQPSVVVRDLRRQRTLVARDPLSEALEVFLDHLGFVIDAASRRLREACDLGVTFVAHPAVAVPDQPRAPRRDVPNDVSVLISEPLAVSDVVAGVVPGRP